MTILIVEDNAPMCQMIKTLVGDLTEGFTECGDGAGRLRLIGNIARTGS
jgi:hypothetical protein